MEPSKTNGPSRPQERMVCMTDNVLFCAAVEKATRADILSPRLFALCFDTDDRGERTVRLRYLRDRAVNICTTQKMP